MKLFYLLLVILVTNILVDADGSVNTTEECEECGEQIDQKIAKLRTVEDIPIVVDIVPPNASCIITGLMRMTRDQSKLVCPQNITNGTTYVITVTVDDVYVKCDVNVSSRLTELPGTLANFINYITTQLVNKCPILKYGPDAIFSGLGSNPFSFSVPSIPQCLNTVLGVIKNPLGVIPNTSNDSVTLSLVGLIQNFTYSPTVLIQNNFSTLRGFQVGNVDSKNFKMWCEGGDGQSSTLKDTCTCLFSSNLQKAFMVGILSFFLTCYPNADAYTEGAYAKIAAALTCDVNLGGAE